MTNGNDVGSRFSAERRRGGSAGSATIEVPLTGVCTHPDLGLGADEDADAVRVESGGEEEDGDEVSCVEERWEVCRRRAFSQLAKP
jgi:hypothetical protein